MEISVKNNPIQSIWNTSKSFDKKTFPEKNNTEMNPKMYSESENLRFEVVINMSRKG